jgi:hypothetical protein
MGLELAWLALLERTVVDLRYTPARSKHSRLCS